MAADDGAADWGGDGVGSAGDGVPGQADDIDLASAAGAAAAAMGHHDEDSDGANGVKKLGTEGDYPPVDGGDEGTSALVGSEALPAAGTDAVGVAGAVAPPPPPALTRGSEFVRKKHARAGPFKGVLLYLDYVRWLWIATDKQRLDREQAEGLVSERVKVRTETYTRKKQGIRARQIRKERQRDEDGDSKREGEGERGGGGRKRQRERDRDGGRETQREREKIQ